MTDIVSLTEERVLKKIRGEMSSIAGLFKVSTVLELVYPEPRTQWLVAAGQGRYTVETPTPEEQAIIRSLEDKKIAPEKKPHFYESIFGHRIIEI